MIVTNTAVIAIEGQLHVVQYIDVHAVHVCVC